MKKCQKKRMHFFKNKTYSKLRRKIKNKKKEKIKKKSIT